MVLREFRIGPMTHISELCSPFKSAGRSNHPPKMNQQAPATSYPHRSIALAVEEADDKDSTDLADSAERSQDLLPPPQKFIHMSTTTNPGCSVVDAYLIRRDMARKTGESISQHESGQWVMSWKSETSLESIVDLMKI